MPNNDQRNCATTFYVVGGGLILASVVFGIVWVFMQW